MPADATLTKQSAEQKSDQRREHQTQPEIQKETPTSVIESSTKQDGGVRKASPGPPPALTRTESTEPEDEVSFAGPPTVVTSGSLETTSHSGGRFVSNTFSYHTSDTEAAASKSSVGQKVFRCEDEP